MPLNCSIEVENKFGPVVRGCGTNFDFTLLFEETILFIAPLALALLLSVHRVWQLRTRPAQVRHGILGASKIVSSRPCTETLPIATVI